MSVFVGLKYCGGCTPDYDRVEFFDRIAERTDGKIQWVHYEDPRAEHVLVVAGCESACVDLSPFKDKNVLLVFRENELDRIVEQLTSL